MYPVHMATLGVKGLTNSIRQTRTYFCEFYVLATQASIKWKLSVRKTDHWEHQIVRDIIHSIVCHSLQRIHIYTMIGHNIGKLDKSSHTATFSAAFRAPRHPPRLTSVAVTALEISLQHSWNKIYAKARAARNVTAKLLITTHTIIMTRPDKRCIWQQLTGNSCPHWTSDFAKQPSSISTLHSSLVVLVTSTWSVLKYNFRVLVLAQLD